MSILVHSSAIPVHSCGFLPSPVDSCAIPVDSGRFQWNGFIPAGISWAWWSIVNGLWQKRKNYYRDKNVEILLHIWIPDLNSRACWRARIRQRIWVLEKIPSLYGICMVATTKNEHILQILLQLIWLSHSESPPWTYWYMDALGSERSASHSDSTDCILFFLPAPFLAPPALWPSLLQAPLWLPNFVVPFCMLDKGNWWRNRQDTHWGLAINISNHVAPKNA